MISTALFPEPERMLPVLPMPSNETREDAVKQNLYWLVLGGLGFWVPFALLFAIYKSSVSVLALNLLPVAGLALLSSISWIIRKKTPRWGWLLAGVYVFGPVAMLSSAAFTRISASAGAPGHWIWFVTLCLLPPMTLWLALLNGVILSVLLVTLVLPLLLLLRRREQVGHESEGQRG